MNVIKTGEAIVLYYNYTKTNSVFAMCPGGKVTTYVDLTICIEGEMKYIFDGQPVTLGSGDAILFPQGHMLERLETHTPTKYASINVWFGYNPEIPISGYLPNCINPDILYLLECFKRDFETKSVSRRQKCLALFSYICNSIYESVCERENPYVRDIKHYIIDNISGDLSLEEIAGRVHLTPQYMCTLFKKHTGMTVVNYILNQRIDLAKRLIISLDEPISDIAVQCGFDDYYYFSHTFKKVTGISASNFRKSIKKYKQSPTV